MNTISELIERSHSQAKAMGWWDEERNTGELLMLIVSECGEALEAHRRGRIGRWQDCTLSMVDAGGAFCLDKDLWVDDFREFVKDGFADELSDIVIRIADILGSDSNLSRWVDDVSAEDYDGEEGSFNVGEQLLDVVQMVANCGYGSSLAATYRIAVDLESAAMHCFTIAKHMNIDLWRHIDLKLRYNLTRGHKHGKAY